MKGKVYIAGAGPGDPALITVKLNRLLESVDVVLYDYLISSEILDRISHSVEKEYVGKIGHQVIDHQQAQEMICERMKLLVEQGKDVLRLKGGDPFVFGRGFEEAQYLETNNITYEIVPGISSAIGGLTYAGIPITHRNMARSFAVVTGHTNNSSFDKIEIPKADTIVFLMAVKNIQKIVAKLKTQNFSGEEACAFIEQATTGYQKTIQTTLSEAITAFEENKIKAPALFVVGSVVALRKDKSWFEKLPLFGKTIVVTSLRQQSEKFIELLQQHGAEVFCHPTIVLNSLGKTFDVEELKKTTDVIFTSSKGVDYFFNHLKQNNKDTRWLGGKNIIAIGQATAEKLEAYCIIPDQIPEQYQTEGIIRLLPENLEGKRFLLPVAKNARSLLADTIRTRNGDAVVWPLYESIQVNPVDLENKKFDAITFASPLAVFPAANVKKQHFIPAFCIGPVTAETAKKLGWNMVLNPEKQSFDNLFEQLIEHFASTRDFL